MTASILDIAGAPKALRAPEPPPRLELRRKVAFFNSQKLPAVLRAASLKCDTQTLLGRHRGELMDLLSRYGALLLRGFPIAGAEEFLRLAALCLTGGGETPGAAPDPGTQNGIDPRPLAQLGAASLPHNEMADRTQPPKLLLFFCETPAARGGETTLADTRALYEHIDASVRAEFERRGVFYQRRLAGEPHRGPASLAAYQRLRGAPQTWQEVFGTDSRAGVEATCKAQELSVEWDETDGSATICNHLPATRVHPATHERLWFNHVLQAARCGSGWLPAALGDGQRRPPLRVLFGDGGRIPRKYLRHIKGVQEQLTAPMPWHQGDLLLVDNLLTCHGHRPHRGQRKVLVAMD